VYETHLLRRSYREGGKVKHDTLGNLSHLPLETIHLIRRSLAGETFVSTKDRSAIERNLPHGHVAAVLGTVNKLGLDSMISSTVSRERNLVVGMIAARLLFPCSKLATVRRWCSTTLAEELGLVDATEYDLYEAMDWLVVRQGRIEKKLAKGHLKEGAVVLYDLTSSYYERRRCSLAQFGHDRDGKKGRKIIVDGVMTDMEGRPVGLDVYPGHTGDPSTVADQAEKILNRFGLKHVVLVGDRGMPTQAQIDKLSLRPGIGWISGLRSNQIRQLADSGSIQMSLFDECHLAEIRDPQYPGERLVVCYNPLLAEERARKREDLLEATEKSLDKIALEASRRKRKPLGKAEMGLKIGRVLHRYKMGSIFRSRFRTDRLPTSAEKNPFGGNANWRGSL
jgi:hypothetical protein